jgi:hypothetical protein
VPPSFKGCPAAISLFGRTATANKSTHHKQKKKTHKKKKQKKLAAASAWRCCRWGPRWLLRGESCCRLLVLAADLQVPRLHIAVGGWERSLFGSSLF